MKMQSKRLLRLAFLVTLCLATSFAVEDNAFKADVQAQPQPASDAGLFGTGFVSVLVGGGLGAGYLAWGYWRSKNQTPAKQTVPFNDSAWYYDRIPFGVSWNPNTQQIESNYREVPRVRGDGISAMRDSISAIDRLLKKYVTFPSRFFTTYLDKGTRLTPNDPTVVELANALKTGDYEKDIENIHNYVYSGSNIAYIADTFFSEYWQLPSETIARQAGDCDDQAFLFASLTMAMGHPVKVKVGVVTDNVGHVWPEILLKDTWVPADTLDISEKATVKVSIPIKRDGTDHCSKYAGKVASCMVVKGTNTMIIEQDLPISRALENPAKVRQELYDTYGYEEFADYGATENTLHSTAKSIKSTINILSSPIPSAYY